MKVLVISSSMRRNSNSEYLASVCAEAIRQEGIEAELISLSGLDIRFCIGCLSCHKTLKCVIRDDVSEIMEKVKAADALVFATPLYFYELSGQLKTFLDRMNPLYAQKYSFRDVYMIATAADDEENIFDRAYSGLGGWVDCYPEAKLAGRLCIGGVTAPGETKTESHERMATEFGRKIAEDIR
ncbi:MAG: flavodoxin family protein [Anaerovoracaceae bacterium]